ncbi:MULTISPECIES: DNA modification methylase [unclassified Mesorhizobium]|uniref:DNA modification methylase n=1 Tax=unclassified Mesorhizobium TaxID=325217 RepID=UPI0015E2A828|nr:MULTISPECIES: DNA modification methylase [unclassified Mesorhizobium]
MSNRLEMQLTAIAELRASPFAVRNHPREKSRKLAAHMRKYGQLLPLLIESGGFIVDGHLRLEVARELGLSHLLTIDVSHLAEVDRRALRLSINRLAEDGKWDRKALGSELRHLIEVGYDLDLTGFETVEIETAIDVLDDAPGSEEHLDARMMSSIAVSRPADIWVLGDPVSGHRIACGDFRDQSVLDRVFQGQTAEVCFTDPPYNVPIQGHVSGLGQTSHREFAMASGEMSRAEFQSFLTAMLERIFDRLAATAVAYVCMDWRSIAALVDAGSFVGLELLNLAVWVKTNPGMGSFLRSQHELVAIFKRAGASHRNNIELGKHGRSRSNVWHYRGVNVMGPERHLLAEHPTVKPSAMVCDAVRDVSVPGDIIFDPFLGSGTTLIAAERTDRRCYGIEIEPTFVDLAIRRWQAETGKDAVRASDGLTFSEAEAATEAEAEPQRPSPPLLLDGPKAPKLSHRS